MKHFKMGAVFALSLTMLLAGCGSGGSGGGGSASGGGKGLDVDPAEVALPLAETATIKGLTNFPAGTESEPNNRTIFKRLEEETNVHVEWKTIQSDQWGDKIALEMANVKTLPEFVFNAGFSDTDLLKYAKQGVILNVEEYIDKYMPNLCKVFEQAPEYRAMCTDADGHIWALPWIEQLGYEKTAIQTIDNMPFINKNWLDFLGLEVPTTVEDFEKVLIAFRDNAADLKKEFNIEGDIIPMSCIMNDGGQDPMVLINGFGEGIGDPDKGRHIAVTDDKKVISTGTTEGFKKGVAWLHELYAEGLIDPEAFTQEWSTYVAKGKSGRYGVCFSWDIANIAQVSMDDLIAGKGWVPLPVLTADTRNLTPQNGSFTSGFDRGRCVITAVAENPALICSWLDQMYAPLQSPQNNWGTYGEDDDFDIFEMSTNANGEPMLKHTWLGDASPVEVREAEAVGGPLAILDSYYDVYVTCPDDAQYRLDWIKDVYTPDMHTKYVFPNVFMTTEDTKEISNLQADITKRINTAKSDWVMNGFTDADWDQLQADLQAYQLDKYLGIFQKYVDEYYK
ncbi:MAG: extracellular solute-binding protein [Erysipelotrichaceae bacterium]|nr:extracellular solute-binding protein [Erysipelotrichaceae bacterium]